MEKLALILIIILAFILIFISRVGGAWRPCYIEVIGVSGSPGVKISSFSVTWYGA